MPGCDYHEKDPPNRYRCTVPGNRDSACDRISRKIAEARAAASILSTGCLCSGDAPDSVEVGEAGIAVDHAMRRQRRVQLVG